MSHQKSDRLLDLTQNIEIRVACYDGHQDDDDDDDISTLSFGDNRSYIFDLAGQKKNRRQMVQQEAFEEAHELYELALEEGADKSEELLMAIFQQIEKDLTESYKEKDKLLDERLEAALQAELDSSQDASMQHPTSSEAKAAQLDNKLKAEETKILKKKIAKAKSMIKGILDDKDALNDEKKSTQLRRLQKKYDQYKAAWKEQNGNKTQPPSTVVESALQGIKKMRKTMKQVTDTIAIPEKNPKVTSGVKSSQKDSRTYRHVHKSKSKRAESPTTQSPKLHSTKATTTTTTSSSSSSSREVSPARSKDTSKRRIRQPETGISSQKSGDTATTAVDTVTAGSKKYYSIEDFKSGKVKDGQVVDMSKWEEYLSPSEFENYFGMSKADFEKIPTWKQKNVKRKLRTWY